MDARLATPRARVAEALWRDTAQPVAPDGEFNTEAEPTARRSLYSGPWREAGRKARLRRRILPPPWHGSGRAADQPRPPRR